MNAPDKIYLDIRYNNDEYPKEVFATRALASDVEYIREGAIRALITAQIRREKLNFAALGGGGQTMNIEALEWVLKQLDTIGEKTEKPINHVLQDFPTTEKEMQDFLATHERIPVPERLNSLERILQEQPVKIDIRKELASIEFMGVNDARDSETIARHFYELGRQSECVKVKAESALDKFMLENCTHCLIEHCPGMRECYTSSNKQLQ